jgi:hypothetical protein
MPTKKDVEIFIYERGNVSWSDLENFFAIAPRSKKESKYVCPKCKSTNVREMGQASLRKDIPNEPTGEIICNECGFILSFGNGSRVSRQTLLNHINSLVREHRINKVIDETTLRPVYQVSESLKKEIAVSKMRKDLETAIEYMEPSELQELKAYLDKRKLKH